MRVSPISCASLAGVVPCSAGCSPGRVKIFPRDFGLWFRQPVPARLYCANRREYRSAGFTLGRPDECRGQRGAFPGSLTIAVVRSSAGLGWEQLR